MKIAFFQRFTSERILILECGPPPMVAGGNYDPVQDNYFAGNTVTYNCPTAVLVGIGTNTCQGGGMWSNPAPVCSIQGIMMRISSL